MDSSKIEENVKQIFEAVRGEGQSNRQKSQTKTISFGKSLILSTSSVTCSECSVGLNEHPDDKKSLSQLQTPISQTVRYRIASTTNRDRQNAYKGTYKTNLEWGGGAKDHPGKKRDKRPFSSENNNYKLARERWSLNEDQITRKSLLDLANQFHNPPVVKI